MDTPKELFETRSYELKEWGITLTLIVTPDVRKPEDVWFSVSPLCDQLGLVSHRQRQKIKDDAVNFGGAWRELPVQTPAGWRMALCLRMKKIGRLFDSFNPNKVNAKFAGKLSEVRASAENAAAKALLGEDATWIISTPTTSKANLGTSALSVVPIPTGSARGEIHVHCPECNAPICVVFDGQGVHVVVGAETP